MTTNEKPVRVLIAVDGSQTALGAVRHVADMLCAVRSTHVTLLHVVGLKTEELEHPGGADVADEDALEHAVMQNVHASRESATVLAEERVFAPARQLIRTRQNPQHPSTVESKLVAVPHPDPAGEVIDAAASGEYDAVVVGRKGQGWLAERLIGSVATTVVREVRGCAVWVVA
jgi:nucleotide-binding universal stress UspA family protein